MLNRKDKADIINATLSEAKLFNKYVWEDDFPNNQRGENQGLD
jgi:hypothetical protein